MRASGDIIIGEKNELTRYVPCGISAADRRQHIYVIGKSGTGKTTLLRNLIIQDIVAGRGLAVIDPHGDLIDDILAHMPSRRAEDVVHFDPADPEYAVAFNPLFNVPKGRRHLVASGIVGAFKDVFSDSWGPRLEYVFYAAVAAVLECQNVSLLSVQRMLSDEKYRRWVVKQVSDPVVRFFWEREFEGFDRKLQGEIVAPLQNKLGQVLMSPLLRGVLGQVRSRVDGRFMMDRGRIFLANLSKGRLGADKSNLIGALLVSHFQVAAMGRAEVAEDMRRDFALFIDEFQSFASDSFAALLSEARKYRLSLVLAHQYLGQVRPAVLDAVLGNVGSTIAFRVGHQDAEALQKAMGEGFRAEDFASLNNREIYAKLLAHGKELPPFRARTLPPIGQRRDRADIIVRRSRERFMTRREVIETRIEKWMRLTQRKPPGRNSKKDFRKAS